MRTLSLVYSTSTGLLSLDSDTVEGNVNDNNVIKITVTGLPEEYASAKIEYGVIIEDNETGVYYPFTELASGQCRIPLQVCRAATTGRLPIGLKITYANQYVECSVNQIVIRLGTYTDAEESVLDVFPDQLMTRGSSWDWLEEWTYDEGAIVYYDGQYWRSIDDGNVGNTPSEGSDHWEGIGTEGPRGPQGYSISASFSGDYLIVTSNDPNASAVSHYVKGDKGDTGATGIQGPQGIQGFTGDSLSASFSGTTLTVVEKDHNGNVVSTTSQDLQGPQGLPAESTTPGELVIRYIGDGVSTQLDVIHNLGTTHPFWQIQDLSGTHPEYVNVYGYALDGNTLRLVFTDPPGINSMAVMVSSGMGSSRIKYEYNQVTASAVWTIEHNLGRKTSFTITDTAGEVIWCDESIIDENTTVETFSSATAGVAIER